MIKYYIYALRINDLGNISIFYYKEKRNPFSNFTSDERRCTFFDYYDPSIFNEVINNYKLYLDVTNIEKMIYEVGDKDSPFIIGGKYNDYEWEVDFDHGKYREIKINKIIDYVEVKSV